ncbi:MAG: sugar phosphate isomerase/epimerase [Ruminococcaceae bacterium]|nr:sugar phosphate isomerase/epimerase [Oscillospiraceae bacterium]
MRFGVCTGDINRFAIIKEAGYDYIEFPLVELVKMSDEAYAAFKAKVEEIGLPVESYNGFFGADLKLVGETVDYDAIAAYAEKGLSRAAALGGKVAVVGSGGARRIPDGEEYAVNFERFAKALAVCGEAAARHGMTIVVEPLNDKETNLVNSVEEGLRVSRAANHPAVKCLADFYHVFMSGESLDAVRGAGEMLAHVHLARANEDRAMPYAEDVPQCEEWAAALKACGYNARVSLEGNFLPSFEEAVVRCREIVKVFE